MISAWKKNIDLKKHLFRTEGEHEIKKQEFFFSESYQARYISRAKSSKVRAPL